MTLIEALEFYQDALRDLHEANERIDVARDLLLKVAETIKDEERLELANFLYWKLEFPRKKIEEVLRLDQTKNRWITPQERKISCRECRRTFIKKLPSKWALKERSFWAECCEECSRKRKEEREKESALYKEHDLEREARIKELRSMPYREYLETPEWKAIRDQALHYAHYRCKLCYSRGPLHVHHRVYRNLGAEYHSDLVVLCESCHSKYHEKSAPPARAC